MYYNQFSNICNKCRALCCKTVGGPDVTKKEMQKILNKGYPDFFVKHTNNHYEIKSKKGTCLYLTKDNLCLIHDAKPLVCKWWPVDYDYKKGKIELFLVECPMTKYVSKRFIQNMKKQIMKLSKKTLADFYSHTYLNKDEIKLVKKGQKRFKQKKLR
jgi:Fe-S-cluster containining protein